MEKPNSQTKEWTLYMIRCKDGSLYTGITRNLERRFTEHATQGKKCAKYLRGKDPLNIVHKKVLPSKQDALKLEMKIKNLSKAEKELLCASS